MTKKELLKAIAKDTGFNIEKSQIALNSVLSNIVRATIENEEQKTLRGFGTLEKTLSKERICRNPQTGGKIKVEVKPAVKFKAGSKFKQSLINGSVQF